MNSNINFFVWAPVSFFQLLLLVKQRQYIAALSERSATLLNRIIELETDLDNERTEHNILKNKYFRTIWESDEEYDPR